MKCGSIVPKNLPKNLSFLSPCVFADRQGGSLIINLLCRILRVPSHYSSRDKELDFWPRSGNPLSRNLCRLSDATGCKNENLPKCLLFFEGPLFGLWPLPSYYRWNNIFDHLCRSFDQTLKMREASKLQSVQSLFFPQGYCDRIFSYVSKREIHSWVFLNLLMPFSHGILATFSRCLFFGRP